MIDKYSSLRKLQQPDPVGRLVFGSLLVKKAAHEFYAFFVFCFSYIFFYVTSCRPGMSLVIVYISLLEQKSSSGVVYFICLTE